MKRVIYTLFILLLLSSCGSEEYVPEEIFIIPSPTEYVFNSEGGTVTITVESNASSWWHGFPHFTNKYGLHPDLEYEEVEIESNSDGLRLFRTNWFEIERIEPNVIVVRVEPNESGNERRVLLHLQHAIRQVGVMITQSAE